jgi:hypothetical protein
LRSNNESESLAGVEPFHLAFYVFESGVGHKLLALTR